MDMGEVDLGLGPTLLSTIIQVIMVDHLIFIVMAITEAEIGIKPEMFIHITMAN